MSLITLPDLRDELGIIDSSKDRLLSRLMRGVLAGIEAHAGRELVSAERQIQLSGGGAIVLSVTPVTAVSVTHDDEPVDVVFDAQTGVVWYQDWRRPFPRLSSPWVVTYTGGYTTETVPRDLKSALIAGIEAGLEATPGMLSERDGDYQYTKAATASGLPAEAERVAEKYRCYV